VSERSSSSNHPSLSGPPAIIPLFPFFPVFEFSSQKFFIPQQIQYKPKTTTLENLKQKKLNQNPPKTFLQYNCGE
jgi:hypothetical protein